MDLPGTKHYDRGASDSIPLVVNDVPADTTFTILNNLKYISSSLEEIKERQNSTEDLHEQVNVLMETVYHLVNQNNKLRDMTKTLQKSLKVIRRELQCSKDKKSQHKQPEKANVPAIMRSISTPDLQELAHLEEALQENFTMFVEHLSFTNTSIPDKLLELECLSEEECSLIRARHDKDQIRHLLFKLMNRGPKKIYSFLKILEEQKYGFLAKSVFDSFKNIKDNESKTGIQCVVCYMRRNVDLCDIVDFLFQTKLINKEIYGITLDPNVLHANKFFLWSTVLNNINKAESFDLAMNRLQQALKGKYDFLTAHLQNEHFTNELQCSCGRFRRKNHKGLVPEFGSQTDVTSTSYIPKFSELQSDDSVTEPDSSSSYSSMEIGTSYENLKQYRRIGPCDSTSQLQNVSARSEKDSTRHGSSTFDVGQDSHLTDYSRQLSVPYVDSTNNSERPRYDHSVSEISSATLCEEDQDIFTDRIGVTDDNDNRQDALPSDKDSVSSCYEDISLVDEKPEMTI